MRILFVHTIGRKKFGGGEKWLVNAAAGLQERGHQVIVGGKSNSLLLQAAGQTGIDTAVFDIISDLSIYHVIKISRFIRKNKIDIVVSRDGDLSVAGPAAKLAGGTPVIVRYGLAMRSSFRKHTFLLRNFASGVITNTFSIRDHFEDKGIAGRDFVKVIYNGIDIGDDIPARDFSERFGERTVILTVARMAIQKGYYYLIDAIALLKHYRPDLVFVFLGTGKLYNKLVKYARDKKVLDMIHFEGFVGDAIPFIRGCDILVLPSLYEGMPNAAMEAMACGKPVVLTDVNGARELVPDKNKGLLIPSKDPQAIADAIGKLVEDKKMREAMGGEAAKFVRANFTYTRMINELEDYLKGKVDVNFLRVQ